MFRVSVSRCEYNESLPDSYPQACPYKLYKQLSETDKWLQNRLLYTSVSNRLRIIAWLKAAFKTDIDNLLKYCYIFRDKAKILEKQGKWNHDYINDLSSFEVQDTMSWILSGTREFNLDYIKSKIKDLFTMIFKNLNISGKATVRSFLENCYDLYNFSNPSWSMVNNIIRSILDMYESDLDVAKVLKETGSFAEFEDNTWNLSNISIACVNHHHTDWTEFYNCPFQHFLEKDIKCLSLFPCLVSHEEKFFLYKYDLEHHDTLTFKRKENSNITIGRSRKNSICLLYQPYAHRSHSTISFQDAQLYLKDIHESNSIWIKEPNYQNNDDDDEKKEQIERNCLICLTNPRKIICKPCWHWTTCEDCHTRVKNNKCLVCKQLYDYTSIMDSDDDEKSMQTMVPYHLRQNFHSRCCNLNLAETYFKKMGFRRVSNGGEYIKQKGTEIALIGNQYGIQTGNNILEKIVTNLTVNSSMEELQKNIPTEDLPIDDEEFTDEELKTLYALFQIITSIFPLIQFSDVKTRFKKYDYNVYRTFKMFNINKNSIVEIVTIRFDELQL